MPVKMTFTVELAKEYPVGGRQRISPTVRKNFFLSKYLKEMLFALKRNLIMLERKVSLSLKYRL